ncbi:hypothetical protein OH492_10265 [Vibrio chagasii]|nr:hypothetical protein [Vibrio chagasii]
MTIGALALSQAFAELAKIRGVVDGVIPFMDCVKLLLGKGFGCSPWLTCRWQIYSDTIFSTACSATFYLHHNHRLQFVLPFSYTSSNKRASPGTVDAAATKSANLQLSRAQTRIMVRVHCLQNPATAALITPHNKIEIYLALSFRINISNRSHFAHRRKVTSEDPQRASLAKIAGDRG